MGTNNEDKLQDVAQECTNLIFNSGITTLDGLLIVLNMLTYHSSLVMSKDSHNVFIRGLKRQLRRAIL